MPWTVARWRGIPGLEHGFGGRADPAVAGVRTLRQVHGREVWDAADLGGEGHEGDGLVTDRPGTRVGVWTADCVPVLLVARRAGVAAAVHSGWRGTAAGVVPAALDLLRERWNVRAEDLEAALGPAIGGCCYEVGEEVRAAFHDRGKPARAAFSERKGRLFLDLRTFLIGALREVGVSRVELAGPCTACRTDLAYSHRREGKTGRQISWVGWS